MADKYTDLLLEKKHKKALVRLALLGEDKKEFELGFATKISIPEKEDVVLITSPNIFPDNIDTRLDNIVIHRWKPKPRQRTPPKVKKIEKKPAGVSTVVFEGDDKKYSLSYGFLTEKKLPKTLCACVFDDHEKKIELQFENQGGEYKLINTDKVSKKGFDVKRAQGAPVIFEKFKHRVLNHPRYDLKIVGVLSINSDGNLYPVLFQRGFLESNRMSMSKISNGTIEDQNERKRKRIESLEKEFSPKPTTIARKKKTIEEEVQSNTERIACLENELEEIRRSKDTISDNLKKIKDLEKQIEDLKEKNEMLVKQLQEANEGIKKIEDKNKDKAARIEKLEKERAHDESVLILVEIGNTLQRSRCKYVLGKYFKERFFYKYKNIVHYIKKFVPVHDQKSAIKRLKELEETFPWDQDLVDSLKILNPERIGIIAHPKLSSEKIQQATEYLSGENTIPDEMMENIMKLKELWETLEDFIRRRSAP